MANKRVKLGEKANSFFDPISKFKVLPNQVLELTDEAVKSKRVSKALKQGHLEVTDMELSSDNKASENGNQKNQDVFNPADIDLDKSTSDTLMKLSKSKLVSLSLFNKVSYEEDGSEVEYNQEELEELSKQELVELLLEL